MDSLRVGFPAIALHEASAAAVARVLEAHEHSVELVPLSPEAGVGEAIDLFVSAWLPLIDAGLLSDGYRPLGLLYRPSLIWCIAPSASIAPGSLDQLAACDTLDRRILVPHAGPLAAASARAFGAYGLAAAGYVVEPASDADRLAWAREADPRRIVPLTRPHEVLHDTALHALADPLAALGSEQQARLLLRAELFDTLDRDLVDELDELTLGNRVVSAMAHAIRLDSMSAEAAADAWQRGKLTPRGAAPP